MITAFRQATGRGREPLTDNEESTSQRTRRGFGRKPAHTVILQEKHKAKREITEKVFAILVALGWSQAIGTLGVAWWAQVLIAAGIYLLFWAIISFSWMYFHDMVFEQGVLFAAELTAFLCRDASRSIFGLLVPAEEEPDEKTSAAIPQKMLHAVVGSLHALVETTTEEPGEETQGDVKLGMEYVAFAALLLVIGMLSFGIGRRFRERVETPEEVSEALADIDLDVWSLTTGWTLQAAVGAFIFGATWMEVVEERENEKLAWYAVGFTLPIIGGLILLGMEKAGVPKESGRFLVTLQTLGFLTGYLMDVFVSRLFLPTMTNKIWAEVTVGSLVYPLVCTTLIAGVIARKRGAVMAGNTKDTWKLKMTILALQMFIALAWEGLFEVFFKSIGQEERGGQLAVVHAVSITIIWLLVCVVTARMEHSEEAQREAAEAQAADGSPAEAVNVSLPSGSLTREVAPWERSSVAP